MPIIWLVPGDALVLQRARIAAARAKLLAELPTLLNDLGTSCVSALSAAAPKGEGGGGSAPAGDTPGPLAGSFVSQVESIGEVSKTVTVTTTQPTKLSYVRYGTGIYGPTGAPIRPRSKKALFWPGADHPVKQVRGQQPNDFVSPIIEEYIAVGNDQMDALAIELADMLNGQGGVA